MTLQSHRHNFVLVSIAASVIATSALAGPPDRPMKPKAAVKSAKPAVKTAAKSSANLVPYSTRDDAMRFADDLAARRDLDPQWVRKAIGGANYLPVASRLMRPAPQGTPKNWRVYRSRFIDPIRIGAGVKFWSDNEAALQRAESEYGVPAKIIVGIIGVETIYGQQMGTFRVIDTLATLSFDFPVEHPRAAERSAYFRQELEQFLQHQSRIEGDVYAPRGSYAGAQGMPQFMPSSFNKYAVDFDGNGKVDLTNPVDAIGSVASYFKAFNWQTGMPTHYPVSFDTSKLDMDALMAPDILPTFSPKSFTDKGAVLNADGVAHKGQLALIELQNGTDPPQYVAGTENFYVITRYNWSSYYAMSVIELGDEIEKARAK